MQKSIFDNVYLRLHNVKWNNAIKSCNKSYPKSHNWRRIVMKKYAGPIVFYLSRLIFDFIVKYVLRARVQHAGDENVTDHPTLFVANHYTRIETALLPYIHWLVTQRKLQVLAHQTFFIGLFGDWLRVCGAYPMDDPKRNNRIIGDLMTGRFNWAIFPEGNMVKNRSVFSKGKFILDCPGKKGPPHTGAAVLALKAEIFKRSYLNAVESNDRVSMQYYENTFHIGGPEEICHKSIVISPISISYYPLRTGDNIALKLISKFFGKVGGRMEEELRVEGNFLLRQTDIDHHFGPALDLDDFLSHLMPIKRGLHKFFRDEDINNLILEWQRNKLTQRCMAEIYQRIYINVDEVASYCIVSLPTGLNKVEEEKLRLAIYTSALEIRELPDTFVHTSLQGDLLSIISSEGYPPLEDAFRVFQEDGLLSFDQGMVTINREALDNTSDFHRIRMTNKIVVHANGLEPQEAVTRIIGKNMAKSLAMLRKDVREHLFAEDLAEYTENLSASDKPLYNLDEIQNHASYFLEGADKEHSIGVLLGHDLMSSPAQMRPLAEKLNQAGFTVYCPRLPGHGTSEKDLVSSTNEEWQKAYNRAFTVLKHSCSKVAVAGFSVGALLALNRASRKGVYGALIINPAISLKDGDFYLLPLVSRVSRFLNRWWRSRRFLEWHDLEHNIAEIRVSRISIDTMIEWHRLRQRTKKAMQTIECPILVLRASDDPVLATFAADRVINSVSSEAKQLVEVELHRRSLFEGPQGDMAINISLDFLHNLSRGIEYMKIQNPLITGSQTTVKE